jgi:glycine dehydrogenase
MRTDIFENRHIGPSGEETRNMLAKLGVDSTDELINQTIPGDIRLKNPLPVGEGLSEFEYHAHLRKLEAENKLYKSYIGLGYHGTITPAVIQRNILENPGWYTAYTPYQAEISQGRLEALLNYQTLVSDLTGLPVVNASLLDEATAGAEAVSMLFHSRSPEKEKSGANVLWVSDKIYPQTLAVIKTRCAPAGITVKEVDVFSSTPDASVFAIVVQYPDSEGNAADFRNLCKKASENGIFVAAGCDLLSLALLLPPGEWGADVAFGNSQRFGVPMGYGGPHAAFFAAKEDFKRLFPGRIIGVSKDSAGGNALRMALQTREQHIRREKATSNICTAQALLAIMAGMYGVYHGQQGIKSIALRVHKLAADLESKLKSLGIEVKHQHYFDTLCLKISDPKKLESLALKHEINFRYETSGYVCLSLDQSVTAGDMNNLLNVFREYTGKSCPDFEEKTLSDVKGKIDASGLDRKSDYLTHPVFKSHHSETELMRYIKKLENRDLSLTHSMIPLGSCTMKLNAAAELIPITWPGFANIHPFVPANQAKGYLKIIEELGKDLCSITGFAGISFQPNSGAQGEYAGLLVIKSYHQSRGEVHRNVALIPSSAHGTNPASAALCEMKIVVVKCDAQGNIDIEDLRTKAAQYKNDLACLMVTYPSTHGVFETGIRDITKIVHDNGGLVYMDGANMNAQVGLTSPGNIGADVCHLNLHKTFAIPHGGGGPGMGPIGVTEKLVPFLPSHPFAPEKKNENTGAVSAAPFGSSLILLISYGYEKMLGGSGLTNSTKMAILNANYMKEILKDHFPILYVGKNGRVAHEMILDCKPFKRTAGVEVTDIAKRLMDYGFHAPTVAFPVADTLMVEPTESESKEELDRFCEAMISIRNEIREIEEGKADPKNNVLKNAPHTAKALLGDDWNRPYSREKAAFPLSWIKDAKFWPSVGRVDNALGDRNLICTCPPIEAYESELVE